MAGTDKLKLMVEEGADRNVDLDLEHKVLAYLTRKSVASINLVNPQWFTLDGSEYLITMLRRNGSIMGFEGIQGYMKLYPDKNHAIVSQLVEELYEDETLDEMDEPYLRSCLQMLSDMHWRREVYLGLVAPIVSRVELSPDELRDGLRKYSQRPVIDDNRNMGDFVESYTEFRDHAKLRGAKIGGVGIKTGIRMFDALCNGVMPGEFAIILGEPGIGKTAALSSFAVRAYREGHVSLLISGEMSKIDLGMRVTSDLVELPSHRFRTGDLSEPDLQRWEDRITELEAHQEGRLFIRSFPEGFTVDDVRATALLVQEKYGRPVEFLALDYLNIMSSGNEKDKAYDSQVRVTLELKNLVQEFNLVCWTANQVTDEAFSKKKGTKKYNLSYAKYARKTVETAPIVVAIVRDGLQFEMQILKMRNAPKMDEGIRLYPNMDFMRIHSPRVDGVGKKSLKGVHSDRSVAANREAKGIT